ncbi:MAG: hypothetical protein U0797_10030 [Gemmataceae bacterium]
MLALAGCKCLPAPEHKDERRAGCPSEVSPCAKPSDTGRYVGYPVGGGAPPCSCNKADAPAPDEGTWGWDYSGLCWPSKGALGWWHGRRYQGGGGTYCTDGPRPLEKLEQSKEAESGGCP